MAAQTLTVVHEKKLWRNGHGTVEITEEGITYTAEKDKNSRFWRYRDIQYFDRISEKEFTILSYEDRLRYLGRDRQYNFRMTKGELTDELFNTIGARIGRPVTNRVVPTAIDVEYEVPVKHLHTFGGCEGTLQFTTDSIYYVTNHQENQREWILARDIQSLWSSERYHIEVHAYDNNRREFSRTQIYRFDLKKPLDPNYYRKLKLKLYDLESVHLP